MTIRVERSGLVASTCATAIQFPIHRPPLHLRLDRFHVLHIHQRRHARLKNNPHQIRFFHRKLAERLQHVVWTHQRRRFHSIENPENAVGTPSNRKCLAHSGHAHLSEMDWAASQTESDHARSSLQADCHQFEGADEGKSETAQTQCCRRWRNSGEYFHHVRSHFVQS